MTEATGPAAPNISIDQKSKLSKLNAEFIRTPEFAARFGDSKIKDAETGEPELWYHGTNRLFDEFKHPRELGPISNHDLSHDYEGLFLTDSLGVARAYADPLGDHFSGVMSLIVKANGGNTYREAFEAWNDLVQALMSGSSDVCFGGYSGEKPDYFISDLEAAIISKQITYSDAVKFRGAIIGQVGELLNKFGGHFPSAADELVAYKSSIPKVDETIEESGLQISIPRRALPRVVGAFVAANSPLSLKDTNRGLNMDRQFAAGVEQRRADPAIDAVIIDSDDYGRSLLVFEPEQLIVAPSL